MASATPCVAPPQHVRDRLEAPGRDEERRAWRRSPGPRSALHSPRPASAWSSSAERAETVVVEDGAVGGRREGEGEHFPRLLALRRDGVRRAAGGRHRVGDDAHRLGRASGTPRALGEPGARHLAQPAGLRLGGVRDQRVRHLAGDAASCAGRPRRGRSGSAAARWALGGRTAACGRCGSSRPRSGARQPFCQQSKIARSAATYSRMRGAGADHGMPKRRVTLPRTCGPRPSSKRPPERRCSAQASWASSIGLLREGHDDAGRDAQPAGVLEREQRHQDRRRSRPPARSGRRSRAPRRAARARARAASGMRTSEVVA